MSIVQITTEDVLKTANTYFPSPHILLRLGYLLGKTFVDLNDVTNLVKLEPELTAQLIRIANSVTYAGREPVASVEEALTQIGFKAVHRIVGFSLLERMNRDNLAVYGITSQRLIENSLLSALLMEELAAGADEDPRSCYTMGLLRSIGKVCLDRIARAHPEQEIPRLKEDLSLGDWELCVFGMSSNGVAATILKAWRFPDNFVLAVNDHHNPQDPGLRLTHLLTLASSMADILGYGLNGESGYWPDSEEIYRRAGLEQKQANLIVDHAFNSFHKLLSRN